MGKFITFEGGEGSGKSTIIAKLTKYFEDNKIDYIATREPGGLKVCEEIRNILKYSNEKIGNRAELLLFSASRAELVDEVISPALIEGKIVLCDRFFDSTRVYQGFASGVPDEEIMNITHYATRNLVPDITFYLDIDPDVAFARKGGRDAGDRIENRNTTFHQLVRKGYLKLAETEPRIVKLDATKTPEEIFAEVLDKLREKNIIG